MAECNYDEVTNSVYPPENPDPMYHWDAHFPERLSRLHLTVDYCPSCPPAAAFLLRRGSAGRGTRRPRDRGRYKTQPITFDEIAEVDDDDDAVTSSSQVTSPEVVEACREARAAAFFRGQAAPGFFSRSVDGLVGPGTGPGGFRPPQGGSNLSGSDKENTPCCCAADDRKLLGEDRLPASHDTSGGGDVTRHRRKRSGRRLRNRNSVPEEEAPDAEKMADESNAAAE